MGKFYTWRNNLCALYAAVMLGRHPDRVKYVFMIGDRQDDLAERARAAGELRDPFADAGLQRMWAAGYRPPRYDLADLARLPDASLGAAYARFMRERGLRPDFYDDVAPRHRMHALRLRLRQTHDIWHVLTGFDSDPVGEVGLQGFYFAQVTNGQSALIFAGAILRSLLGCRYAELERFVAAFCDGYGAGRQASSLLAVRWEEHWHDSVAALRERHAIRPASFAG